MARASWQAGGMTRSTQQEGKPTQKQRRGDPGVEPQQKGPHVDWHFWANQVAALWTFSQLKRNSARFGARRRRLPEGLLHATECSAPSANRHYYSLEMTGLETNSCPFQRAPRLLPQSVKRQPSMAVNRQSLRRSFRTFPSRYMVARVRLPLALEYQEVTTHTHTHTFRSAKGPKRPKASSLTRPRMHTHTHAHAHYALLPDLASDRICILASRHDLCQCHCHCHCPLALPITNCPAHSSWPVLYKSRFNGCMHGVRAQSCGP